MDRKLHVKQDEWAYPATKTKTRGRVKRARAKAKRVLSKKMLQKDLQDI